MKKFLVMSGFLLSVLSGYGNGKGDSQVVVEGVSALSESRAILIFGLGLFGAVSVVGLFLAVYYEKRQSKRLIAAHDARVEEFRRALRRSLSL